MRNDGFGLLMMSGLEHLILWSMAAVMVIGIFVVLAVGATWVVYRLERKRFKRR